jgi:hypothetical protein
MQTLYTNINMDTIQKSWVARYYHLCYLLRFNAIAIFIFNLQQLTIMQVLSSFVICVVTTVFTFIHYRRYKIFKMGYYKFIILFQEVTFFILILLILFIFLDQFKASGIVSAETNQWISMAMVYIILFNIILEIISLIIKLIKSIIEKIKNYRKKKLNAVKKNQIVKFKNSLKIN